MRVKRWVVGCIFILAPIFFIGSGVGYSYLERYIGRVISDFIIYRISEELSRKELKIDLKADAKRVNEMSKGELLKAVYILEQERQKHMLAFSILKQALIDTEGVTKQ